MRQWHLQPRYWTSFSHRTGILCNANFTIRQTCATVRSQASLLKDSVITAKKMVTERRVSIEEECVVLSPGYHVPTLAFAMIEDSNKKATQQESKKAIEESDRRLFISIQRQV